MRFSKTFSLQLFVRFLFSLTFFIGGAGMVFWAQGFRFDFGDNAIVSTGVVSASTFPAGANIVMGSAVHGKTPKVLLGIPIGSNTICFYKEDYSPYCRDVVVGNKEVTHIFSVVLLPNKIQPLRWGSADEFLWDPWDRGFVHVFPRLSSAYIYEQGDDRFYEPLPEDFLFTDDGTFLFPFRSEEKLFSGDPVFPLPNVFLPDNSGFLFSQGNILSLRMPAQNNTLRLTTFKKPIQTAFFLPDSESIIASTDTDIIFLSHPSGTPQKLFSKDADMPVRFFAKDRMLFWKKDGFIYSHRFE